MSEPCKECGNYDARILSCGSDYHDTRVPSKTRELLLGLTREYNLTFDEAFAVAMELWDNHNELSEAYWRSKIAREAVDAGDCICEALTLITSPGIYKVTCQYHDEKIASAIHSERARLAGLVEGLHKSGNSQFSELVYLHEVLNIIRTTEIGE